MNTNMISSSAAPYWISAERGVKTGEACEKSFGDFLEEGIAVSKADSFRKKFSVTEPSYTITDEEAEYFRQKYGEKYDEDTVADLYYELADKNIISRNDAGWGSNYGEARPLSSFKSITYIGGGDPYGLRNCLYRDYGFVSDKVHFKDVSRTDKDSPYKPLWESFKKTYHCDRNTWEDVLQENLDFERYIKENKSISDYEFQQHRAKVIEGLEKTKDVITRIFGEVTL